MSTAYNQEILPAEKGVAQSAASSATQAVVNVSEANSAAIVAREMHEVRCKMEFALTNPRDEETAYAKALAICKRPSFAERGVYAFPRGGTTVKGPSVNLARQIKRVWGNIWSGHRILLMDEDTIHLQAQAVDLESNVTASQEARVSRRIMRKPRGGGKARWVRIDDEREIRELVNRHGSILERNVILQLLPADIVDDMQRQCERTVRDAASGKGGRSQEEVIRSMVAAFMQHGITREMLERKLGNSLEDMTNEQRAELLEIFNSIQDGNSRRSDHFDTSSQSSDNASQKSNTGKLSMEDMKKAAEEKAQKEAEVIEEEVVRKASETQEGDDKSQGSEEKAEEPKKTRRKRSTRKTKAQKEAEAEAERQAQMKADAEQAAQDVHDASQESQGSQQAQGAASSQKAGPEGGKNYEEETPDEVVDSELELGGEDFDEEWSEFTKQVHRIRNAKDTAPIQSSQLETLRELVNNKTYAVSAWKDCASACFGVPQLGRLTSAQAQFIIDAAKAGDLTNVTEAILDDGQVAF